MTSHFLDCIPANLHAFWSPDLPPVLTIDPGDTVTFRTLDADWGLDPVTDFTPGSAPPRRRARPPNGDTDGHALTGPVAVRGAQPGMALAVRFDRLVVGPWGFTWAGKSPLAEGEVIHRWTLDAAAGLGRNHLGHTVALRPFMGVIGLPPAEPGHHSTTPPRPQGGNLDCKELVEGSTLYLPIAVPGALFSVGDGHAAQGDGEVSRTAIECPMDEVTVTFTLRDDLPLTAPRAETPAGWLTFGFGPDLDAAGQMALDQMLDLLAGTYGISRLDAFALASVAVDLRITQIVNQLCGCHALLPRGAIRR
jgi:acetamidase/formamidase